MMNNLATDIESGMPDDKLKAKYEAQGKSLKERMDKLGKPSAAEEKRLEEKYKGEMEKAGKRMVEVMVKKGSKMNPQGFGF